MPASWARSRPARAFKAASNGPACHGQFKSSSERKTHLASSHYFQFQRNTSRCQVYESNKAFHKQSSRLLSTRNPLHLVAPRCSDAPDPPPGGTGSQLSEPSPCSTSRLHLATLWALRLRSGDWSPPCRFHSQELGAINFCLVVPNPSQPLPMLMVTTTPTLLCPAASSTPPFPAGASTPPSQLGTTLFPVTHRPTWTQPSRRTSA